jgi:hypothetical protein
MVTPSDLRLISDQGHFDFSGLAGDNSGCTLTVRVLATRLGVAAP